MRYMHICTHDISTYMLWQLWVRMHICNYWCMVCVGGYTRCIGYVWCVDAVLCTRIACACDAVLRLCGVHPNHVDMIAPCLNGMAMTTRALNWYGCNNICDGVIVVVDACVCNEYDCNDTVCERSRRFVWWCDTITICMITGGCDDIADAFYTHN